MKKAIMICCCLLLFFLASIHAYSKAFTDTMKISYRPNEAHNFKVELPAYQPSDSMSKQVFLLEYGDGSFTTDSLSSHHTITDNNKQAFAYSYFLYDTTPRPRNITISYKPKRNSVPENQEIMLGSKKNINIFRLEDLHSIRPMEQTHFVITYKNENAIITVFYNKDSGNFFKPIIDSGETFITDSIQVNPNFAVKSIRCYSGQKVYTNSTIRQIPSGYRAKAVTAWNRAQDSGYHNAIFIINTKLDKVAQKNVFITLSPPLPKHEHLPLSGYDFQNDSLTYIQARFISSTPVFSAINSETYALRFTSSAHDPNSFYISKICDSSKANKYSYSLYFENTGLDSATNIRVGINLPATVNIDTFSTIICTFSNTAFKIKKWEWTVTTAANRYSSRVPYFTVWNQFGTSDNTILIYFPGQILLGTRRAGSLSTKERQAHLLFTLPDKKILPAINPVKPGLQNNLQKSKGISATVYFDNHPYRANAFRIDKCMFRPPAYSTLEIYEN